MALLSKNEIGLVYEILPSCDVHYVRCQGGAGVIHLADLAIAPKRVLGPSCADKMDGQITLDTWQRKLGQRLLMQIMQTRQRLVTSNRKKILPNAQ